MFALRVALTIGSSLLFAIMMGRRTGKPVHWGLAGLIVGSAISFNTVRDLWRGPIEVDVLSAEVVRHRVNKGTYYFAELEVLTTTGERVSLSISDSDHWRDLEQTCRAQRLPVERAVVLRSLAVALSVSCGDGVITRQCESGQADACKDCERRGRSLTYGEKDRSVRNFARAVPLFAVACEHADAAACTLLAHALLEGSGGARDPARAATLYRRACDAGQTDACGMLGRLLAHGDGVSADPIAARSLLERACRDGFEVFCEPVQ